MTTSALLPVSLSRTATGWKLRHTIGGDSNRAEFDLLFSSGALILNGARVVTAANVALHDMARAASTCEFAVQMARDGTPNPHLWPYYGPNHGGLTLRSQSVEIDGCPLPSSIPSGVTLTGTAVAIHQACEITVLGEVAGSVSWSIEATSGGLAITHRHHCVKGTGADWKMRTAYQRMVPAGTDVNRALIGPTVIVPAGLGAVVKPGRNSLIGWGSTNHDYRLMSAFGNAAPVNPIDDADAMGTWLMDNASNAKIYDNIVARSGPPHTLATSWVSSSTLTMTKGAPLA